jgi:hypothetical protein
MTEQARIQTLQDLRNACTHPCAIEVKHAASGISQRFCLLCGAREKNDGLLALAKVVRTESSLTKKDYYHALSIYTEYLHRQGLFEKFDAEGRWLGDHDPPIRMED